MDILAQFRAQSKELQKTIVLPEGKDPRILDAAEIICKEKIAKLIILGDVNTITTRLSSAELKNNYIAIDPTSDAKRPEFAKLYHELRQGKKGAESLEESMELLKNELFFGTMLVRTGSADGCLAGAVNTTAAVLKAALRTVNKSKGIKTISSSFIMATPRQELGSDGVLLFADCAVNPDPDAEMLADIAISTAQTCKSLLHIEPKIAMLSFSTKGSSRNDSTEKVIAATELVKQRAPELEIDGELQLDAAIVPSVGASKAPGSKVAGKANVLIFPDLDAGNIGYKLVQRFAGADAIGPMIQGFDKPVNDLSRGASVMDIVNMTAVSSVQSTGGKI
jgi:phosphate acetyltransferase